MRSPNRRRTSTQVVLGHRRVARVEHQVGQALELVQVLVRVERDRSRPPTCTGNMFSTATVTPALRMRSGSAPPASGGNERCQRYGGCMTTSGTSASAATSIARSTLPTGSVPQTRRVSSRHGAWIAPIVSPCSAASRAHLDGILAGGVLRDHDLDAVVAGLGHAAEVCRRAAGRRTRPTRTGLGEGITSIIGAGRARGQRAAWAARILLAMWVFPLVAAAVVAFVFAGALVRRYARSAAAPYQLAWALALADVRAGVARRRDGRV